jgi:tRNA nucleotidyltransferase/poly(A) polymerase
MDENGKIYDPLGIGLKELQKQSVIFVGNAEMRVREDYLRILRYVRFTARFSKGKLDLNYLKIFTKHKKDFKKVSIERITDEILKTILLPFGIKALQNFEVTKILPLPKLSNRSIIAHKKIIKFDMISHSLLLALWSDRKIAKWNKINQYLRLPKAIQTECISIIEGAKLLKKNSEHEYKLLLYKYGHTVAETIILFDLLMKDANLNSIRSKIKKLRSLAIPVFKLSGKDLIKRGMRPSPEMGATLKRLEQVWIQSDFDDRLLNLTNLT